MCKFICTYLIVLMPVLVLAQYSSSQLPEMISPTSYDARARAMGRTGIMSAVGSNAMFYNPANLGLILKTTIEGGGRLSLGSISDEGADFDYGEEINIDYEASYKLHPKITNLSFAMPFQPQGTDLEFVFGIGYNTHFDYGLNREEEVKLSFEFEEDQSVTSKTSEHGGFNTISPAVAVNINNQYYFGLALNKSVMGRISGKTDYDYEPDPDEWDINEREWEADLSSGIFYTLGGLAKLTPELSVGFMYRSGFETDIEDYEVTYKQFDGDTDKYEWNDEEWKLPPILGLGASYLVSPSILVVGEYQTRAYSDVEVDGEDYFDIDNGACYRLGVEFAGQVPVRVGVFSDALLISDIDENDDFEGNPKSMSGITAGFAIVSDNLTLDFFGEYASWGLEYDVEYVDDYDYVTRQFDYKEKHLSIGASFSMSLQ
jgi:hypothetical protein